MESLTIGPRKIVHTSLVLKTLAMILLVFCIPLEAILKNQLISWQIDMIINLQDYLRTDSLDDFSSMMMLLGDRRIILLLSPFIFHFFDARVSLKMILIFCYSAYLYSVVSLLTKEPRPFWVSSDIQGIVCGGEFGNPSKQTMVGISVFTVTMIELFHARKLWVRIIAYGLIAVLQTIVGLSTIYLGAHFPHQVLMSCLYAVIYLTAVYAFDKSITNYVYRSGFSYHKNRMSIIYWLIATVVMFLIVITIFDVITIGDDVPLIWLKYAREDCSYKYDLGYYSFFDSAFIIYALGAVTGSIFTTKYLNDFWWATAWWKSLIRGLIATGSTYGIVELFSMVYLELIPVYDVTTQYTFYYAIPYWISSFLFTGVLPLICVKFQLALPLSRLMPEFDEELEKTFGQLSRLNSY